VKEEEASMVKDNFSSRVELKKEKRNKVFIEEG